MNVEAEMSQQLRALASLAESTDLFLSTQMVAHNICKSNSRGHNTLFLASLGTRQALGAQTSMKVKHSWVISSIVASHHCSSESDGRNHKPFHYTNVGEAMLV